MTWVGVRSLRPGACHCEEAGPKAWPTWQSGSLWFLAFPCGIAGELPQALRASSLTEGALWRRKQMIGLPLRGRWQPAGLTEGVPGCAHRTRAGRQGDQIATSTPAGSPRNDVGRGEILAPRCMSLRGGRAEGEGDVAIRFPLRLRIERGQDRRRPRLPRRPLAGSPRNDRRRCYTT